MIRWLARRAWAEVRYTAETVGYWLRPYDMLAGSRRWFWQPRQRCGWPAGTPASVVADAVAAVRRHRAA